MSYKVYLYAIFLFLSIYVMFGINFNGIMKKGKVIEANILVIILSGCLSYLLTNFVWDFIGLS